MAQHTAHSHREVVPGCFRCDLSSQEVPADQGAREALVEQQLAWAIRRNFHDGNVRDWVAASVDEIARLVAAQVEAAVSVVRAEAERWRQANAASVADECRQHRRAESAEADLRALREGLAALAAELGRLGRVALSADDVHGHNAYLAARRDLRALLAPSPAEGTGDIGLNCPVCGSGEEGVCLCDRAEAIARARWIADGMEAREGPWETVLGDMKKAGLIRKALPDAHEEQAALSPAEGTGEADDVDLNESNDSPGWRDYRNWLQAGRPKDWKPGTIPAPVVTPSTEGGE